MIQLGPLFFESFKNDRIVNIMNTDTINRNAARENQN